MKRKNRAQNFNAAIAQYLKEVYNEIKTSGMAQSSAELDGINRAAGIVRKHYEKLEAEAN